MEHLTINDLPNELLEMIFDQLDGDDLKDASLVCKRWSDLVFVGRRMGRVKLVPNFPWDKDMLQSNRKYRHLELSETENDFAYVRKVLLTFNVFSLRIENFNLTLSSLRLMLLEVPNLQHLSIDHESKPTNEMSEPFPVMRNLKYLEIGFGTSDSSLPWHTIAPSLQALKMDCESEAQLEQWRLYSGQLKQVYAKFYNENLLNRFCEMTFPLLEELSIKLLPSWGGCMDDLLPRYEFFRRNTTLRRLRLDGIYLSKTLVQDITNHNKKLAFLDVEGDYEYESEDNGEEGSLESLVQLTEIKHLGLENLGTCIFRGCKALTSLQSLSMNVIEFGRKGTLGFFKDLFKIAPQLRSLELWTYKMSERAAHFICNNFLKLTRLRLTHLEKQLRYYLSGIDRLPHLWYLELNLVFTHRLFASTVPQNKVHCLTLHLPSKYDEDELLRLPEIFCHLDQLNLVLRGRSLRESNVDKLRQLLPKCVIKLYGYAVTSGEINRCFRKWRSVMMPWEKGWTFYHTDDLF